MFSKFEKFKQLDIFKFITFFPRITIASVNNVLFLICVLTIEMLGVRLQIYFSVILRNNVQRYKQ